MDPLVVSLAIDPDAQRHYDELRSRLFPRSPVGAHVTLFHALPGDHRAEVDDALHAAADRPPFALAVTEVMSLGRGTAYRVGASELEQIHAVVRRAVEPWLTRQDAQPLRAHITVQNKVEPAVAKRTQQELRSSFTPHGIDALGLDVWAYRGGPWQHLRHHPFTGTNS